MQTVQPDKGEPSEAPQKAERLDVLEGLRKYALREIALFNVRAHRTQTPLISRSATLERSGAARLLALADLTAMHNSNEVIK